MFWNGLTQQFVNSQQGVGEIDGWNHLFVGSAKSLMRFVVLAARVFGWIRGNSGGAFLRGEEGEAGCWAENESEERHRLHYPILTLDRIFS